MVLELVTLLFLSVFDKEGKELENNTQICDAIFGMIVRIKLIKLPELLSRIELKVG